MWEIFDRRDDPEQFLVDGEINEYGYSVDDIEELYGTDEFPGELIDDVYGLWAKHPDRNVRLGLVGFSDPNRRVLLLVDRDEYALGLGRMASDVIMKSELAAGLAEDVTSNVDDLIRLEVMLDDESVALVEKEMAFRAFVAKLNAEEVTHEQVVD